MTPSDFKNYQKTAEDPDTPSAELERMFTSLLDEREALVGSRMTSKERARRADEFNNMAFPIWNAIISNVNAPSSVFGLIRETEEDALWVTAAQNPSFDLEMIVNPDIFRQLYLAEMRAVTSMFRNGVWPESQTFLKELAALARKHSIGTSCTKAFLQAIEEAPRGAKLRDVSHDFYKRMKGSKVCSDQQLDRIFQTASAEDRMVKNIEVVRMLAATALDAKKPAAFYHDLGRFLVAQGRPSRKGAKLVYKPLREELE